MFKASGVASSGNTHLRARPAGLSLMNRCRNNETGAPNKRIGAGLFNHESAGYTSDGHMDRGFYHDISPLLNSCFTTRQLR
jgi:hypothetical protein